MNVLKNQPFFRLVSQPTSPSPAPADMHATHDRTSRPLGMLSFSNFMRSPPVSRPHSPAPGSLVLDASYLETLGLKISEAVTRALVQPVGPAPANELLFGKRPIPPGRGRALGTAIVSELEAARGNPHLYKAIVRSLHKPLSVLLNNLSTDLSPILGSPAIYTPPSLSSPNPNPTQIHALAIATFAAELLEKFDELDIDARSDSFNATREGLVSLVTRVVNHLVHGLKTELTQCMEALETPHTSSKATSSVKSSTIFHPSIVTLQNMMPIYARCLMRYTSFPDSQLILASFLITIVWKALVGLANRPHQPSSMSQHLGAKKRSSPTSTPPVTPPTSRFAIKLPPSRPPSPQAVIASAAMDARVSYELLTQFPRPEGRREEIRLAREAVDEAFISLKTLVSLLELADTAYHGTTLDFELGHDISNLSLLIALPVILQAWGRCSNPSIPDMLGLPEEGYRKTCLSGFGRAEECEIAVAQRILDALRKDPNANPTVLQWIEQEMADD